MEKETWVAVDGHGNEVIFPSEPYRCFPKLNLDVEWGQTWEIQTLERECRHGIILPKGTIKYLTGRELKYSDKPVKININ